MSLLSVMFDDAWEADLFDRTLTNNSFPKVKFHKEKGRVIGNISKMN